MQTENPIYAPLWRRVLAAVYDLLPLAALLMIATAMALLLTRLLVPVDRADAETLTVRNCAATTARTA